MANQRVNFSEVQALYELCTTGIGIEEFCAQQGINYQKFQTWQRKQLWNEKTGKAEEVTPSRLNAVKITDMPTVDTMQMKPVKSTSATKPTLNPIRYIQVKLPEGVTITRTNVSTEEVISLLTKLTAALC